MVSIHTRDGRVFKMKIYLVFCRQRPAPTVLPKIIILWHNIAMATSPQTLLSSRAIMKSFVQWMRTKGIILKDFPNHKKCKWKTRHYLAKQKL